MKNGNPPITPCLWFDGRAEEAAAFYASVFPDSEITRVTRYGYAGHDEHGQEAGTVMTVAFRIGPNTFTALNGGPLFQFNEAVSFQVPCKTQEEVDYYWDRLSEGGDKEAQRCGWLKDKFGVSWQVYPTALVDMIADSEPARSERVMTAMMQMTKIDLTKLVRAYEGT